MIGRIVGVVSVLALFVLVTGVFLRRPGPGYHEVQVGLRGGLPATMYYQDPPGTPPDVRPGIERPIAIGGFRAGVVVAHGFAGDRHTMEALSQSLARAGYTVLSLDLSGHGLNDNPLPAGAGQTDALVRDIATGVQFLRQQIGIEPAKIAVLGHSMGARATLDFGSRAAGMGGLVMLSGSSDMLGKVRPRNALFLYAERDLPGIARSVLAVASGLTREQPLEQRRTYGDFAAGTAVRIAEIPGVRHGTILASPDAFGEVVSWLDQVTGFPARTAQPAIIRNPLGGPLLWISFLLVLPGLGLTLGRLAPQPSPDVTQARWLDLLLLPVALVLPLAFLAVGRPGVLLGLSMADGNVTQLALAGVLLVVGLTLMGRFRVSLVRLPALLGLALGAWLAVSALLAPASAYFHGVGLTLERGLLALWSALCLAPFAVTVQWLASRPRWWHGTLLRLAARVLALASVVAGNALGVFGFPGTIAMLVLIASLVITEPVLAGFYGRSRNVLSAAGIDAVIMGWLFAVLLPTT
jgi:pimeloyl-ACP methyl ester carboxylesterase